MYIDIHTHGGFGVNFNDCDIDSLINFKKLIKNEGIEAFCPTLATDKIQNLKKQIEIIKSASLNNEGAKILGIHLEAVFLSPKKPGIHPVELLKPLNIENYKELEDDFIRIVTLAPELDEDLKLTYYLKSKGIKVHAGHTTTIDLKGIDAVTHTFNAMDDLSHKHITTSSLAISEDVNAEIIADGRHVIDELLKIFFKSKPIEKIFLISDSLPIAHSDLDKIIFCNKEVYKGGKDLKGTLAGSSMFLGDIAKRLRENGLLDKEEIYQASYENQKKYLY